MDKSDCLDKFVDLHKASTGGLWRVVSDDELDTVWITTDAENANAVALLDYNSAVQNKADADFIVAMHNHGDEILSELKELRARTLELLKENSIEVEKRILLQNELNKLKEK